MEKQHNCLTCVNLRNQVERQSDLISQLMRIVAATNKKVTMLEHDISNVTSEPNANYSYPNKPSCRINQ
ncbi:hypothetical protein [Alkalibacillus haloalkaliphilus]|uniref:Uncharacterized protein n=1 Tax=Alkalibacillus haloalkaliphilus TaxID=94136 RepID=A0A511W7V7_9BACI|nr:hypothetical protein [Alkalibacillus haloalkaliphilus]GEN47175.1 hypothetical protein AHA02nite_29510 [Alkalibacillus haloalkaliphilus]